MSKTIARNFIKTRGEAIGIAKYYLNKIDNVSDWYIMPKYAIAKLSDYAFKEYVEYAGYTTSYNAGGYDGWSTAHEKLLQFGFKEVTREAGHRSFVHLEWSKS